MRRVLRGVNGSCGCAGRVDLGRADLGGIGMKSAVEALTNAVIGLGMSWAITFYALPLWGLTPSASASAGITATYFFISFARSWAIREAFRKWQS